MGIDFMGELELQWLGVALDQADQADQALANHPEKKKGKKRTKKI